MNLQAYLTPEQMAHLNRFIIATIEAVLRMPVPSNSPRWDFVFEHVQATVNRYVRNELTEDLYLATRTDLGRREMAIVFYRAEERI